jgi:hypothetical protein
LRIDFIAPDRPPWPLTAVASVAARLTALMTFGLARFRFVGDPPSALGGDPLEFRFRDHRCGAGSG